MAMIRRPQPFVEPGLRQLLDRLERQAAQPAFREERALGLQLALRYYYETNAPLAPLPEEMDLATLYLYADFFPQDGQLSLIEQIRDTIETHVPDEERAWLDPLRHSAMDLLEVQAVIAQSGSDYHLQLRSLGDGQEWRIAVGDFGRTVTPGQVLLTRLIRLPDRALLAGTALVLSGAHGRRIFDAVQGWRRNMELSAGAFSLRDWQEVTKLYGYLFLWEVARIRLQAVIEDERRLRFLDASGRPYLYARAQYEHCEQAVLAGGLAAWTGYRREAPDVWCREDGGQVVARLTLTPFQLLVECDSPERLNDVKHQLASAFGFSLHFRGEVVEPPAHETAWQEMDLTSEISPVQTVTIPADEARQSLAGWLESVYLEWADRPSPALGGETPRHAVARPGGRERVAALIDELERADPGWSRSGRPAYDYNCLRVHVGLAEVAR